MPQTVAEEGIELLHEACSRNTPLELHYVNDSKHAGLYEPEMLLAQTRLLEIRDGEVCLDSVQRIGKDVRLQKGTQVDAFFTLDGTIYTFRTVVTRLRVEVDLNRKKQVFGICLRVPSRISEGQRREDHRISVAMLDPIRVTLHDTSKEEPNCCPLDARVLDGRMINISCGGIAVRIEGEERFRIKINEPYFMNLSLPDSKSGIDLLAEVRHTTELPDGMSSIFGFQFLRWPDPLSMRQKINHISRFTVEIERQKLQIKRKRR